MMFIGNIILIINYYTWFKKVVIKKQNDKATSSAPTMKYKIINGAIGGVALPALLLPTTFAFTQLLFYTTTSKATREQNTLSKNLYEGLDKVNEVFNWFSYYKSTARDFDALFAGLSLNETKVQITLPNGEAFEGSLTDAISETFTEGFQQIYNTASEAEEPEEVVTEIKKLGES
ncbi:MAG: hypothetical protein MJ219_01355 [Mycoplasmoidaceae bacterium]|nr:hypothetical protein [Mycoplasmoidaceae bacterium]